MLEYAIQQALERWQERGRERDAIKEGHSFLLRYSWRFKLIHLCNLLIFTSFLGLTIFLMLQDKVKPILYLGLALFGSMTLFSTIYVLYAFTSRVTVSDQKVTVRAFGLTLCECTTDSLATAYKSRSHESVVLQSHNGKKTRVSTQLDGLRALVAWLWLRPREKLSESMLEWMAAEAPDLYQPEEETEQS